MSSIADIRKDYKLKALTEQQAKKDPIDQFSQWWEEAVAAEIEEVNAMTLATASSTGIPDARIVLLKEYDANGFVFFTNYTSAKGQQMEENPHATLVFFWKELERQVRISGRVERVSEEESDQYYNSRPEGSRIGAWASPQSQVIESREWLDQQDQQFRELFRSKPILRPPHWGGYRVKPVRIEFWQGRSNRLHDRLYYTLNQQGSWTMERLAP
ncbi:pyridoxamine 5'-phosphate oxidase [Pseudoflavitalea sp. X16]|uniref:pyridoxamine 5'-phosphate oxidase n=1 Tax=Paraflavitalea devenefica TaxID=2716334 RepID=UPI0014243436|nr:pyridoxamine 5'-phosphate oxidase [Paraflavitalea devenefica]NII24823.1 pyridoxamine 5'-phosphate oxidase [Paraflavitalea devenefica]